MRHGGDSRGSNRQRRRRKLWLLGAIEDRTLGMAPFGGDGHSVNCVHCNKRLNYATVQADRIHPGKAYKRPNVQPSCGPCNKRRGTNRHWVWRPHHHEAEAAYA